MDVKLLLVDPSRFSVDFLKFDTLVFFSFEESW